MKTLATFWHRHILRLARTKPWLIGSILFILLFGGTVIIGAFLTPENQFGLVAVLDTSGTVIGLLSMAAGWPVALLAWARRKEAGFKFENPGDEVVDVEASFDASLILASRNCQPEWHLRHICPGRVEFVATSGTREATEKLLRNYRIGEQGGQYSCRFLTGEGQHELSNEDAYQLQPIKRICRKILLDIIQEYPREKVCVDITAGTGIMTVAAFQVAEELGVTSIYLLGTAQNKQGSLIIDSNKISDPNSAKPIIVSDHRKRHQTA